MNPVGLSKNYYIYEDILVWADNICESLGLMTLMKASQRWLLGITVSAKNETG